MFHDYSLLCEIVGGKIQSKKIGFFAWQWHMKNRFKLLKQLNKEIWVHVERMQQHNNETRTRSLEFHISPALI